MCFYAPDAVWDLSGAGIGSFEGVAAIRDFVRAGGTHGKDHHHEVRGGLDLGHGVVFAVEREDGPSLVATATSSSGAVGSSVDGGQDQERDGLPRHRRGPRCRRTPRRGRG